MLGSSTTEAALPRRGKKLPIPMTSTPHQDLYKASTSSSTEALSPIQATAEPTSYSDQEWSTTLGSEELNDYRNDNQGNRKNLCNITISKPPTKYFSRST